MEGEVLFKMPAWSVDYDEKLVDNHYFKIGIQL